ncbi:hypothetical protein K490DRAFT_51837 [Saccharata proteae CBS 121410]|uniref:Uncharacterized protein n=1 Tax=Saccharata proteae CBS 121410 TaxID=1314787 RepID=A0A9P4HMM8_9PEZI|nr:hypothetical protein K490DRAFT_51837 [Saccharata proteae CBS 121410]
MADNRRQSIGKYVKRLRTVLKRDRSSKGSLPTVQGGGSSAEHSVPKSTAVAPTTTTETKPVTSTTGLSSYSRSAAQQERARALFAKYGLTLEAHEWITTGKPDTKVERVEKPIRMRVHRQCHRCQTTFGPDRVCLQCEHKRCKKCPRYPAKKDKGKGKEKEKEKGEKEKTGDVTFLTIKPRSGVGPDLERRAPKQRVRRSCHHCGGLFVPATATTCIGCQHTRCTKCPREPSKRKKWPDGYPGDVQASDTEDERVWRKPRQRVRWNCERCDAVFMEKTKICTGCGHERCPDCKRAPPKKTRKEPDPDIVKAVEERLARFKLESVGAEAAAPVAPAAAAV